MSMSRSFDDEFRVPRRPRDRLRVPKSFSKPSRAKQSFKDECDINIIMKKFNQTGLIQHTQKYQGRYEDVAESLNYQESLNNVLKAQDLFYALPSKVRARFENDPGFFLDFASNPENQDELISLGLATRKPSPAAPIESPAVGDLSGEAIKPPA